MLSLIWAKRITQYVFLCKVTWPEILMRLRGWSGCIDTIDGRAEGASPS